jgi:hypothetical protein
MDENTLNDNIESFRVVLMADSSSSSAVVNSKVLRNLLSNIKELSPQPNFIFFIGDMVYGGSKVNEELELWKGLVEDYYPITKFYCALGNHEDNEDAFSNAFSYLPDEQLKGYKRTVYYVDYYNSRFIVLNANRCGKNGGYAINLEQRNWLENNLKASDKKYNFVMMHVPAFPTGHHYGECLDVNPKDRDALWKIFEKYEVTAVFTGHEHNYCRRRVDKAFNVNGVLEIEKPIYHITTGGAGTSLNAHNADVRSVEMGPLPLYHYSVMDISDDKVFLHVYDKENNLIDACSIFPNTTEGSSNIMDEIIIPIGAEWLYLDNGVAQVDEWIENSFDDSSWSSGLAELGYGDGGEATVVSYGTNTRKKYITTYFRKHFNIVDSELYDSLTIRIQRDDGAVVYINGKEVYRTNMPSTTIKYDTLASKALSGADESSYVKTTINGEVFINGENLIAVEVHQASASSSDLSFNLQLIGHKSNL